MDAQIELVAQDIAQAAVHKEPSQRLLVALAGPPGCGKSTIVDRLGQAVSNAMAALGLSGENVAVSQDGWHLPRTELDKMDDPQEAHWRRGAAFTFDHKGYSSFIRSLRCDDGPISYLTFDHAVKDPRISLSPITAAQKIVILEGLYTMYDREGWRESVDEMDIRIWIDVDRETARRRLIHRNFKAGISTSLESAAHRVDLSDMLNGEDVRSNRVTPTHVIRSVDEPL